MTNHMPEQTSVYAAEGTAAHELAEIHARHRLLGLSGVEFATLRKLWREKHRGLGYDEDEMSEHAEQYAAMLESLMAMIPNCTLMLEQRVPTGVPFCWGTSDAIIVSPQIVHITDYKYGKGVVVKAVGNPQLRLYGVGALEAFGDILGEVHTVRMTVFQPRLENIDTEELRAVDLREWRDSLIPIAERALGEGAEFGPSESACRWCGAAGSCPAQLKWATERDFGTHPDELTDEQLAKALADLPAIEEWLNSLKQYCLDRIYSQGRPIPGWKVVRASGRRYVTDSDAAIAHLQEVGYALEAVANLKIKGIGELEKVLGRNFDEHMSAFIDKSVGNPALVPASDRRRSITPGDTAKEDFA